MTTIESSEPGAMPVPNPVERRIVTVLRGGQDISEEQRLRVARWLEANGIDPKRVAREQITIESQVRGDRESGHLIGFTEYYVNADGHKVINEKTHDGAVTYERWVRQTVPLEPDPAWGGWSEWELKAAKNREGAA
ncbi:hypothetical protein [Streptomyces sp. NPDC059802]|uniref:hypothetical protein n=1 Tax=Streptomyces sp. NPDC059802 TaxID=3346952 RepID=UPI00364F1FDA